MPVDFMSLRDCDPSSLSPIAAQWNRAKSKLADAHETATGVDAKMAGGAWFGAAADAAVEATGKYARQLTSGQTEAGNVKDLVDEAREAFTELKKALDDVLATIAADEALSVDDTGKVTVTLPPDMSELSGMAKFRVLAQKEMQAMILEAQLAAIVANADLVDSVSVSVLRDATGHDSGTAAFTPDHNGSGLGSWFDVKDVRLADGRVVEIRNFTGYRREHDYGEYGKFDWKLGGQGNVGGYLPDDPNRDRVGGWAGVFAGLDGSYKAPTFDLGMDGVSANLELTGQAGVGQSATVGNDPRLLNIDHNGSEIRIQSNGLISHTFEKLPITVGVNADVTVDLEEFKNNLINDTVPRLPGW